MGLMTWHLLRLVTLGGDRGRQVVEALRGDPVFGKEASALLKRRGSSPA